MIKKYHAAHGDDVEVMIIPDIESVNYGRGVGYEINEYQPSEDSGAMFISASKIRESIKNGIKITCLPGPTALIPALVLSGLSSETFIFEGFLPRKKGRKAKLKEISDNTITTIIYESPHRIIKTLYDLLGSLGADREISVSREISKMYEETYRGSINDALNYFSDKKIKGEFVICINKRKDQS